MRNKFYIIDPLQYKKINNKFKNKVTTFNQIDKIKNLTTIDIIIFAVKILQNISKKYGKSFYNMSFNEGMTLNTLEITAKSKIEYAISKRISKIIFIHGVGEGVLKNELHYLFGRYPVRFYDASYKKYGLGATEVYVYQNQKS